MKLTNIPLGLLMVDPTYQRDHEEKQIQLHIERITAAFEETLLDPLHVSIDSAGQHWVWDGGCRLAVLRQLGWKTAPCLVEYGEVADQARQFAKAQKSRRALSAYAAHRANLAAADELAIVIDAVVRKHGFSLVAGVRSKKQIDAVAKVYQIHDRGNLGEVLFLVREAWGFNSGVGGRGNTKANLLGGLSMFLADHPGCDQERLVRKLSESRPVDIIRQHDSGAKHDAGAYLTIRDLYNQRLSVGKRLAA